jgi:hypothetical protein
VTLLLVIESEAVIFRRYAELGSVRLLKDELEARGIKSKSWTTASGRRVGGKPFSRGALYLMLQNRHYRGEIVRRKDDGSRTRHYDRFDREVRRCPGYPRWRAEGVGEAQPKQ